MSQVRDKVMKNTEENLLISWFEDEAIPSSERTRILACKKTLISLVKTLRRWRDIERELARAKLDLSAAKDVLAPLNIMGSNHQKSVAQINLITGRVVRKFDSISDASLFHKCHASNIANVLSGRSKSAVGYGWRQVSRVKTCPSCRKQKVLNNKNYKDKGGSQWSAYCLKCIPLMGRVNLIRRRLIEEKVLKEYANSVTLILKGVVKHVKPMCIMATARALTESETMKTLNLETKMTKQEASGLSIKLATDISENMKPGSFTKVMNAIFITLCEECVDTLEDV